MRLLRELTEVNLPNPSELNDTLRVSTIDHFFWNSTPNDFIMEAGVLHLPDNLSDHSPVFCKIKTQIINKHTSSPCPVKTNATPCWEMATDTQKLDYCNELHRKLQILNLPACAMNCYDVHCKNEMHICAMYFNQWK